MKKKNLQHNNGITVCDSIVMSVQKKRINLRWIESVIIAIIGYVSTIMAFFTMFDINFSRPAVIISAVMFSVLYIMLSLTGKKGLWVTLATVVAGSVIMIKIYDTLHLGYQYVYNIIYRTATHRDIDYYKLLSPELEESSVTVFLIFCTWVLAWGVYAATIYKPEAFFAVLVTFPVLEIGLYNGIRISVLWGMLTVAYWFAVFAMSVTDSGEYSGGHGGFVRKDNVFLPKREMRLKVTEKCGMYIIATVLAVSVITSAVISLTGYERSDKLNEKRIEIRDAVNDFSLEDLAGSISSLTSAFGLDFKVQAHKLGNVEKLKYKEVTDLTVTIDNVINNALYLKEYTGSVYLNNEWLQLADDTYKSPVFDDFEHYGIYPQDFPYIFNRITFPFDAPKDYTIKIDSDLRSNRSFAPYGTENIGIVSYDYDMGVNSRNGSEFSYKFAEIYTDKVASHASGQTEGFGTMPEYIEDYPNYDLFMEYISTHDIPQEDASVFYNDDIFYIESQLMNAESLFSTSQSNVINNLLAMMIEKDYRQFVYDNYRGVPDTPEIREVMEEYSDILNRPASTPAEKLQLLYDIRERIGTSVEYTLNPGKTPNSRDFVNYFLLENKKGYCTHYATSGVVLARMAGIPARYATGYVVVKDDFDGIQKNPDGTYTLDVKDSRAHAWAEVYIDGYGWIPFEFTAGYTNETIDTTPTTETTSETTETTAVETSTETDGATSTTNNRPRNSSTSTTTTTIQTTGTTSPSSGNSGTGSPISIKTVLNLILYIITAVALVVVILIIRRAIVLYIRRSRFTKGAHRHRMAYIYGYAEKLLAIRGFTQNGASYADFAELIEKSLGEVYFSVGSFRVLVDTALRSAFSEYTPNDAELEKCAAFASELAGNIYKKSGNATKLYLKLILVLV